VRRTARPTRSARMSGMSPFDEAAGLERVTATLRRLPADRRPRGRADRRRGAAPAAPGAPPARLARRRRRPRARRGGRRRRHAALSARRTPAPAPQVALDTAAVQGGATAATTGDGGGDGARRGGHGAARGGAPARRRSSRRRSRSGGRRAARGAGRRLRRVEPDGDPMTKGADGTWTATVQLTPGRHTYAFVVDDTEWVTDRAPRSCPTPTTGARSRSSSWGRRDAPPTRPRGGGRGAPGGGGATAAAQDARLAAISDVEARAAIGAVIWRRSGAGCRASRSS
jgi:hypothetical protein